MTQLRLDDLRRMTPILTPEQEEALRRAEEARRPSFAETVGAAWRTVGLTRTMARRMYGPDYFFEDDPSFKLTEDMVKDLGEGLPNEWLDEFAAVDSVEQAYFVREQLLDLQTDREKLARAGVTGFAAQMAVGFTDPSELAITIGATMLTGPLGLGARVGQAAGGGARLLPRAVQGGLVAAGTDTGIMVLDNALDPDDYSTAMMIGGALLSFGLGTGVELRALRKIDRMSRVEKALKDIEYDIALREAEVNGIPLNLSEKGKAYFRDQIRERGMSDRELVNLTIERYTPEEYMRVQDADPVEFTEPRGAMGAATPETIRQPDDLPDKLPTDFDGSWAIEEFNVPKGSKTAIRIGDAARFAASDSNEVRKFGKLTVENPIPDVEMGPTQTAGSEWTQRMYHTTTAPPTMTMEQARAEWAKARGKRTWWNHDAEEEFYQEVGRVHRSGQPSGDPHIDAAVAAAQRNYAKFVGILQRHGVPGSQNLKPDPTYMPRVFFPARIHRLADEFDDNQIITLIENAWFRNRGEMDASLKRKIAAGFYDKIRSIGQVSDLEVQAFFRADDRNALAAVLRDIIPGITEDEMSQVLGAFKKTADPDSAKPAFLKHRARIDDTFAMELTRKDGTKRTVRFDEMLDNNALRVMQRYNRKALGAAAASEIYRVMRITGETAATRRETLLTRLADDMRASGIGENEIRRQLRRADVVMRHITAVPLDENPQYAAIARGLRDVQLMRVGGRFGWAQVADIGSITAETGTRALLETHPDYRALVRGIRNGGKFDTQLAEEMQEMFAFGAEGVLQQNAARFDFTGSFTDTAPGRAELLARRGANLTARASGLLWLDGMLRQRAGLAAIAKWKRYARTGRTPSKFNLAAMGLEKHEAEIILEQIRKHGGRGETGPLGQKMNGLNMSKWDPGTREVQTKFIGGINRWTRRVVQQNDIGQRQAWMSTWWGNSMMQFRGFALSAWDKQLVFNIDRIHRGDALDKWQSAMMFSLQMLTGGVTYVGVVALNAAGKPEKERNEYLAERLSMKNLALGAFQRAGISSLIPGGVDTALGLGGFEQQFSQGRTSGLDANFLFGNPTIDQFTQVSRGTMRLLRAPVDPNYQFTQADFKAFRQLIPFQNLYGIQQVFDAIQYSLPEKQEE